MLQGDTYMYMSQSSCSGNGWRIWYLIFGMAEKPQTPKPQPRHLGCGDIWESMMSQPWPKMRYQFLFYHGTTELTLNQAMLSIEIVSQLSKFKEQGNCIHWVTWSDCFAKPINNLDVTVGLVSLEYLDTHDKKMSQDIQWFKGNYKKA